MAAIRHSLQKEVCDLSDEQLLGVLHVTKPGKKKKTSFLCAVITKEKPVNALVHQVCYYVLHNLLQDCTFKNMELKLCSVYYFMLELSVIFF